MIEECDFCGFATWLPCRTRPTLKICSNYTERQTRLLEATLARVDAALNAPDDEELVQLVKDKSTFTQ